MSPNATFNLEDANVKLYELGDFELLSGETIADAHLAYRTYGDASNPAIVYPTWFSGTITDGNEWLIALSDQEPYTRSLDPSKFFIIVPALFGNGESTSLSTHPLGVDLPRATFYDNVRAQNKLVYEHLGVQGKVVVIGWSMGAAQTFQWASQFPDSVRAAVPFCGSARTAIHNWVFLESLKATLTLDPKWNVGKYDANDPPVEGLKAFGTIYAGWGFSQAFYREHGFKKYFGIDSASAVLDKFWHAWSTSKDANNLLYMLYTWQHGDVGAQPLYAGASKRDVAQTKGGRLGVRGDGGAVSKDDDEAFERALKGIRCPTLIVPCKTDLYFPPEDSAEEARIMGDTATLEVIPSIWGHWAGGPGDAKDDVKWLDDKIYDFFLKHDIVQ
ncbi:related to homoserine O-acetyltransferase [Sporisorium reilianum f. sp. reilianum]|uniref:Related to homoserine O-acetyltransferase n=1 Tax=Sporisorium reilianum f. sp. reilianum TaxID=72559 RepID=A0A2N8UB50_9BASI|nr:related to homoserine O-acetyltransferase [Sporisorium reilianum f. sp. reilianum]